MLRIGVLASHEGTTLQSIIDACAQGRIDGRVVVVISNNSECGALRRAAAAGIETCHVSSLTHPNADCLDAAICDPLQRARADVIFLAGYMAVVRAVGVARPFCRVRHSVMVVGFVFRRRRIHWPAPPYRVHELSSTRNSATVAY